MSASVWRKCKLRDIAYIYRGGNFQKNAFTPEGKPCIHYGQMYTHFGTFTDRVLTYIPEDVFKKSRIAVSNDVVMAITSETVEDVCSCVAWIGKDDIAISGHTVIIHHQQDAKFLSYYFHSDSFFTQKSRVAHGSKVIEMNPSDLEKTIIVLPQDIKEQRHISDILSTCDTVIQKTQKTIDKYKAIKQGMMQDLFTRGLTKDGKLRPSYKEAPELYKESELGMIPKEWNVDCIGNNYMTYAGGTPSREHEEYYKGTIPWVSSSECNQFEINDTNEHITEFAIQNSSTKMVKAGAILLALYGATAGQVAKLNIDATTNQAVLACLSDTKNDNNYLYYYINYIKEKMLYLAQGSGQPNLSKASVDKFIYLMPQKNEQIEIAKRLSSIDSTIQKEETILAKYKKIKTGLMARLLTPPENAEIINETGE